MKIKRFTLLTLPVLALAIGYISLSSSKEAKYFPRQFGEDYSNSAKGYLEYIQSIKADPVTGEVDPQYVFAAEKQVSRMPKAKASLGLVWQFQGPDNVGGRTRALLVDKNNPNHIYAGGVAGGLFKSIDKAREWKPYDDDFKVNLISSITQGVDGSIYVGTGGHFENYNNTKDRGYFFIGSGVHKLTGDGNFETIVAPTYRGDAFIDYTTIGEVAASKVDNDILWVAMNNGLRKIDMSDSSITDPIGLSQRCDDIKIGDNDSVIVVTYGRRFGSNTGKIFVSHDGGNTFTETTPSNSNIRRVEIAIAPSDNNIIYAAAAGPNNCLDNIYRSRDAGLTWEVIGPGGAAGFDMYAQPSGGSGCQGDWDNTIQVYPDDPGKIIVGGITLYKWVQSTTDPEPANGLWSQIDVISMFNENLSPQYVHADKHAIEFDPTNSDIAYIASDGGIGKSVNMNDELPSFTTNNYKYGVTQFYGMDVNGQGVILAGAQDNGSQLMGIKFNNNLGSILATGGDGFDAALSNIDTSVGVSTSQFNSLTRVQGIGTTSGNTNLSGANITNTNLYMSAACGTPTGCSPVFYSTIELWESFNHLASTDYVTIDSVAEVLPPIPWGDSVEFESNNNARILQKRKVDASWYWPDVVRYWDSIVNVDTITPAYQVGNPFDTISEFTNLDTFLLSEVSSPLIVNLDTLTVDTINKTIQIKRRANVPSVINRSYTLGTLDDYRNFLLSVNSLVDYTVDTLNSGAHYLALENKNIQFRYIDTIRTGIYPFDTVSAGSGRFDTLLLNGTNNQLIVNFDTFTVDANSQIIYLNRRADSGSTISTNYTFGTEYDYTNLLIGDDYDVRYEVDTFTFGSETGTAYLIVEEMNVRFRYSFKVQDRVQTMLASANWWSGAQSDRTDRNIMMTRDLLKGNTDIVWNYIAGELSTPHAITSDVLDIKFTPDGNHMFVGTRDGGLYRVSSLNDSVPTGLKQSSGVNLNKVVTQKLAGKCHRIGHFPNRAVTSIAIDPNNSDNVIVALGNYNNQAKVARFYNATTITDPIGNYDFIQGNGSSALPLAPAYAVMIDYRDPNKVLIGNDFGVFATDNAFDPNPTAVQWTEENTGLGQVPVFEIKQIQEYYPRVKNSGAIYIATHGRGVYRADQLVGLNNRGFNEVVESKTFENSMKMFPNPVQDIASIEFKIEDVNSPVLIDIYNIRGQKVKEEKLSRLNYGKNTRRLNFSDLDRGTYIIRAVHQNQVFSTKFIKQ
ncbi:MAG: hypothetical protein CMC96_09055 [Flavobacteriales bacterium]|nr:hypothetical protein [Flavobacteriales bacterium]|tara:strand:+ start:39261 stop:42983 length:3723 start_codon:yes stop_codon:yes gene_type:complete